MPAFIDMTGERYGRLIVVERVENKVVKVRWKCVCDCGKQSVAFTSDLRSGRHASCGCLQIERVSKHGHSGFAKPPSLTYRSWLSMVQRCTNPNTIHYHRYGGRGIAVCQQWLESFAAFLRDVGERPSKKHTIDRINNDGNYEPSNVRWATRREQSLNRSNNTKVTHDGRTLSITEWSDVTGLSVPTIRGRLHLGWSVEETLTNPHIDHSERKTGLVTGKFTSK